MENPQAGKPPSVVLAVRLLWGSLAFAALRLLLELPNLAAAPTLTAVAGGYVVGLMIYAFLILKISAGRNWARIAFLVLMVGDLLLSAPGMVAGFGRAPLFTSIAFAGVVLQLWGLALLFMNPGRSWFRNRAAG